MKIQLQGAISRDTTVDKDVIADLIHNSLGTEYAMADKGIQGIDLPSKRLICQHTVRNPKKVMLHSSTSANVNTEFEFQWLPQN